MSRRRTDRLPWWPALAAALLGSGLVLLGRGLRAVDDALVELA